MTTQSRGTYEETNPWAYGVRVFAGCMLATIGVFQILQGIAAVAEDDVFVTGIKYVYEFDVTAWGWIHIVIGAVAVATGIGILMAQTWAAIVGIGIALLSALSQFAFMPYYPLWALLIIAVDILIVWALARQFDTPGS